MKIFRKLREELISSNRTAKYLKYAIGEIILVVIGILLAIQVNSWKEKQDQQKIEVAYLEGIISNLDQDIQELEALFELDSVSFKAYTDILLPFKEPDRNIYNQEFIRSLGYAQYTHDFDGISTVFEDMKSSGKINYIGSDALRFALLEYYNLSGLNSNRHNKNNDIINALKDEAFTTNIDLNSMVEMGLFQGELSAELDPLDLSFFQQDTSDPVVKDFANRISLMKGYLNSNHQGNLFLVQRAKKLRALIISYLDGKNIDYDMITDAVLEAIVSNDIPTLKETLTKSSLSSCHQLMENYPISYLSLSLERGALESARYFIDSGSDLELVCFDKTPLMYAAKHGHLEMVKYLLDKGADINVISVEDKTALDYAINYKHPKIELYLRNYLSDLSND